MGLSKCCSMPMATILTHAINNLSYRGVSQPYPELLTRVFIASFTQHLKPCDCSLVCRKPEPCTKKAGLQERISPFLLFDRQESKSLLSLAVLQEMTYILLSLTNSWSARLLSIIFTCLQKQVKSPLRTGLQVPTVQVSMPAVPLKSKWPGINLPNITTAVSLKC